MQELLPATEGDDFGESFLLQFQQPFAGTELHGHLGAEAMASLLPPLSFVFAF